MPLLSSWLKPRRRRPERSLKTFVEPIEPRLLLAGDLVGTPTGILPIGAAGYTLNSAPDDRFANVPVAIFADAQGNAAPGDFTATIDWGDGSADTAGRIIRNSTDTTFFVLGTHRYASEGQFNTTITIAHDDGRSATAAGVAFISDTTHSAAADFSADENPSGVWTYGSSPEGFVPYGDQFSASGLVGWGNVNEFDNEPNVVHNPASADVTFGGVTYRPNQLAFTPGPFGEVSILLFTAPTTGVYHFTALFRGLDDASANLEIFAAGTSLLDTAVTGAGLSSTQFLAAPVSLTAGETITFLVDDGSDDSNDGDTIALDVRVTEISQLPTLFGTGAALSAKAGTEIQSQLVGTFFDTTGQSDQTDFTARIRWGDGTATNGNITATANGAFQVVGTHEYKDAGTYDLSVIVRHTDGRETILEGVAVVQGGRKFTARGVNVVAIEGLRTARLRVATFTDSRKNAEPEDYTARITWGDNSASDGVISRDRRGRFIVRGRHTYRFAGRYSISVTIEDDANNTLRTTSTAGVVDAPKLPLTTRARFTTGADSAGDAVFSFIDVNPFATAGNYTATIDWGDDTSPGSATLRSNGRGRFDVISGAHAYANAGTYTIRIRLTENNQSSTYRLRAVVRNA